MSYTILFLRYDLNLFDDVNPGYCDVTRTLTSSYLNEMHNVIFVNLCHSKRKLIPQKSEVTGPSPSTYTQLTRGLGLWPW